VAQSQATLHFRQKELERYRSLVSGPSPGVTKEVFDERVLYYESAVAGVDSAKAIVEKAKADLKETEAKLAAAQVDIHLKEALVEVARKDKDYARAMLGFATINAPFDGEITERRVDPGSFVRNAATAQNASLLTLDRVDIVTVTMKVPDNYALFVTQDTEAVFEILSMPGVRIRSKVARFSGSLVDASHDRTMPVEVDLFNGSAAEYTQFLAKEKASGGADLKDRFIPPFPQISESTKAPGAMRLLPGMYGRMRLILNNLSGAYLLPSSAIFSAGGNSYLFLVRDGKAVRTRIDVEVDDGKLAKVALIEQVNGVTVRRDLKGGEVVVLTNQGELEDGQEVKATPEPQPK
jgi:multidrug efflux pump subunit AcrA (membrane-fusion protein)